MQKNDVGTILELTVTDQGSVVDLSDASTLEIIFGKPDGTFATETAAFSTDGTDGKMRYVSEASDFALVGAWRWQGNIVNPAGSWKTTVATFRVKENLE